MPSQLYEKVFQCTGCGYTGTYPQCNGHRLGAGRSDPACAGPPKLVTRRVDTATGEITQQPPAYEPPPPIEAEDTEIESEELEEGIEPLEDEDSSDEGAATVGHSQDRLPVREGSKGPRGAIPSSPVGVPSSGASPSTIKQAFSIPAVLMAFYDWVRVRHGYQGRYEDFIVESALDCWFGSRDCPNCGSEVPGFEIVVAPKIPVT